MFDHMWLTGSQRVRTTRRKDAEAGVSLLKRRAWFAEKATGEPGTTTGSPGGQVPPAAPPPPAFPTPMDKPQAATPAPSGGSVTQQSPAGETPDPDAPPDWINDPAKAFAEIKRLREEAAKHRVEAQTAKQSLSQKEAAEKSAAEKQLVDKGEWQKVAEQKTAENAALQKQLQEQALEALRLKVGVAAGLPAELIARLQGATEDEMKTDAEALKAFVKPDAGAGRQRTTTGVPGGQPQGTTYEDRKRRHYGGGAGNPFAGRR